jgi:hypothetical protein
LGQLESLALAGVNFKDSQTADRALDRVARLISQMETLDILPIV